MSTAALLNSLAAHGTILSLNATGGLRVHGAKPAPDLLVELKAHKPELVAALQEARALAMDLNRMGETEAFAAELAVARKAGTVSVIDQWASGKALMLAREEENPTPTPERTTPREPEGEDRQALVWLVEELHRNGIALVVMPDDGLRFEGGEPPDTLRAQVVAATGTVLAAATLSARLDHGEALCDAATGAERERLEAHWKQLERAYQGVIYSALGSSGAMPEPHDSRYRRHDPVTLAPIWIWECPTVRRDPEIRQLRERWAEEAS